MGSIQQVAHSLFAANFLAITSAMLYEERKKSSSKTVLLCQTLPTKPRLSILEGCFILNCRRTDGKDKEDGSDEAYASDG